MNPPLLPKVLKGKGEHVHELGNEAKHSQTIVPNGGRKELNDINGQECIPNSHQYAHPDIKRYNK